MQTNVVKCLFHRRDIFEQKAAGCVEVVQSSGHSVSLSFGAVSDCRREGRLPPLSLRSPETQRGRAAPHGVGAREGGTAPFSGGLQGCSSGASSGPGTGPGRPLCLARTRKPSPADLETLGFLSAASARKPSSAQAQCSPPQSRTEEGGSGAQHLRSGLSRISTKSLLYLPSNLNLSKFPLAVLELREEEILLTV